MSATIEQRWKDYCMLISETARRFSGSETSPNDEVTSALNRFINSEVPTTEAELGIRIGEGDQLQTQWNPSATDESKQAYSDSENHESIPLPTQSIAKQAEMARTKPDK